MTKYKMLFWKGIHGIQFFAETSKYWLLFPFAWMKYHNKNVWVVSERGTDARDNGYHFFRYMKENHPEQEIYFILKKKSADYPKVKEYGHIIEYRSIKHYMIYAGAKVKISTHDCGCAPDRWWYSKLEKRGLVSGKIVCLQHGITKDDMVSLHKENTGIDLFICGAKPEYDYVLNHFGYTDEQVKYTGFARFDKLLDFKIKNQILVMPTWRMEISSMSDNQIQNSEYVRRWNSFLKNKDLAKVLEEKDIDLVFYPHYEMQPYLYMFASQAEHIRIASFDKYDVQQLLKESRLLVTDYSSVYFDFAYMGKAVVYYQFDREYYRKTHYKAGYFDYDSMGFGPIAVEENTAIEMVNKYLELDFLIDKIYEDRVRDFFMYHDNHNCERIYGEIRKDRIVAERDEA